MKNFTTQLLTLALLAFGSVAAYAQAGTQGDNFLFRLTTSDGIADYKQEVCGYGYAAFGPDVTEEISGEIVWAYGQTDSLCCDTITQDLTGKFAMIQRGVCNFSLKAYYAQQAGAKAVLVVNHYNTATDDGCSIVNMAAGTNAALVTTTPSIFLGRTIAEQIKSKLALGETVMGAFLLPRMLEPTAAYHYATPISQIDTLANMTVRYINRSSADQTNVELKADIIKPDGSWDQSLTVTIPTLAPGIDTTVTFPEYLPPAALGDFTVLYSNNQYTESRDSLIRHFKHTNYTYATDNFINDPGGIGPTNAEFATGGFVYQPGALVLTGDTPGAQAAFVSFGISNIDSVFVDGGSDLQNTVSVFLYDGDPDDNGTIDVLDSWTAMDDAGQQVAYGTYIMNGTETDGQILSAPLNSIIGEPTIDLKPNHVYYASVQYNGTEAGLGRPIRFMNSLSERYLNFPTTPLYVNNTMYTGWAGDIPVMCRLQLAGFDPIIDAVKPSLLSEAKFSIKPNPANDLVNLDLKLDAASKNVTVQLLDWTGRTTQTMKRDHFQNGIISFDTRTLPSGVYVMWISTDEGMIMRKVAVCH